MSSFLKTLPNIITASRLFFAGGFLILLILADRNDLANEITHNAPLLKTASRQLLYILVGWVAAPVRRTRDGGWPLERIMKEIRRRTRVVISFPHGPSALMLAAARLRYLAGTQMKTTIKKCAKDS